MAYVTTARYRVTTAIGMRTGVTRHATMITRAIDEAYNITAIRDSWWKGLRRISSRHKYALTLFIEEFRDVYSSSHREAG